jgi:hypothetical protein
MKVTLRAHRIRLRPLLKVPRPAIIVFERTAMIATFVCQCLRKDTLRLSRQSVQSNNAGARRWGIE